MGEGCRVRSMVIEDVSFISVWGMVKCGIKTWSMGLGWGLRGIVYKYGMRIWNKEYRVVSMV